MAWSGKPVGAGGAAGAAEDVEAVRGFGGNAMEDLYFGVGVLDDAGVVAVAHWDAAAV